MRSGETSINVILSRCGMEGARGFGMSEKAMDRRNGRMLIEWLPLGSVLAGNLTTSGKERNFQTVRIDTSSYGIQRKNLSG